MTGGTTLIVHVLTPTHVYTANVGDCKSVLSSRGACVELNTCHNPNVPSERDRFQASRMRHTCKAAPRELTAEKPQRRLCVKGLAAPRGFPLGTPRRQQLLAALWRTCCLLRASAAPLAVATGGLTCLALRLLRCRRWAFTAQLITSEGQTSTCAAHWATTTWGCRSRAGMQRASSLDPSSQVRHASLRSLHPATACRVWYRRHKVEVQGHPPLPF